MPLTVQAVFIKIKKERRKRDDKLLLNHSSYFGVCLNCKVVFLFFFIIFFIYVVGGDFFGVGINFIILFIRYCTELKNISILDIFSHLSNSFYL